MISVTLYETFCANTRRLMEYHGINQSDLAAALNVTPPYISQLLNGRRRPGLDTIEAVAKALRVNPARLLEDVPEKILST